MLLNCGVGVNSWESLGCKEIQPVHPKVNQSWMFIGMTDAEAETPKLATWCKELTHWKRPWFRERVKAGGEGDNKGWDGWMASLTWWTWVWVNSGSWWCTGRPGVLQFMGSQSRTRLSDFTFTFHFSLSCIGEGNGNPLRCSCLENPRDGGAWCAAVYGVAQSRTRLKWLSSSSSSSRYFCLERGTWLVTVHGVLKSQTRLSN